jgi:hypothetical protein
MTIPKSWRKEDLEFAVRKVNNANILGEVKMKAKAYFVLIVFMLLGQEILMGMSLDSSTRQSTSSSIAAPYYFAKVIARTTDGKSHYGLLAGIENDYLILKKGTSEERFSFRDVTEVSIELGKRTGSFMASGMVLGIYLGNMISYRAGGQPFAYLDDDSYSDFGFFYMDFIFASAGIGLGYLASLFEKDQTVFRFSGGAANRLAEWERLKSFLAGRPRNKKIHLSIQAGQVLTGVSQRYQEAFANAHYDTGYGFEIISPVSDRYQYIEGAKSLNLLRKAQLTVSLQPKIDVGAAAVFSGEPGVGGYDYGDSGSSRVWQTYKASGYYAVAVYKPLSDRGPKKVQWSIGLGAGASRVAFELGMYSQGDYPDYEEKWAQHKIAQTVPSGLAFTELGFFFGPNTSLGLMADFVFGPSRKIPEFPEWNIPGQKIRLGNGSLGIVFGMHF